MGEDRGDDAAAVGPSPHSCALSLSLSSLSLFPPCVVAFPLSFSLAESVGPSSDSAAVFCVESFHPWVFILFQY
jgi:hypothetical protein